MNYIEIIEQQIEKLQKEQENFPNGTIDYADAIARLAEKAFYLNKNK